MKKLLAIFVTMLAVTNIMGCSVLDYMVKNIMQGSAQSERPTTTSDKLIVITTGRFDNGEGLVCDRLTVDDQGETRFVLGIRGQDAVNTFSNAFNLVLDKRKRGRATSWDTIQAYDDPDSNRWYRDIMSRLGYKTLSYTDNEVCVVYFYDPNAPANARLVRVTFFN